MMARAVLVGVCPEWPPSWPSSAVKCRWDIQNSVFVCSFVRGFVVVCVFFFSSSSAMQPLTVI